MINLDEANIKMAFAIQGQDDRELKYDPRYVRLFIELKTRHSDGTTDNKLIPYHYCKEEDFAKFYPLQAPDEESFNEINEKENGWICFD